MDATSLRVGLADFLTALQRQLVEMREYRDHLTSVWAHTREVYQGRGAEDFRTAFERSSEMQGHYIAALETMIPLLEQRLQSLERFDATTPTGD